MFESTAQAALGARVATVARVGDAVLLHGDYGAGKTCFTEGFLRCWFADAAIAPRAPSVHAVYEERGNRALLPGVAVPHLDIWGLDEKQLREAGDLRPAFSRGVRLVGWLERLDAIADLWTRAGAK